MVKRGVGDYQLHKEKTSKKAILNFLSDEKPHRYEEIKQKTKLSSATLSKHLKELAKGIVERFVDSESREWPPPVYYRLSPQVAVSFNKWREFLKTALEYRIEDQVKNPERLLESLNQQTAIEILETLRRYYENGNKAMLQQTLDLILDYYREFLDVFQKELEKVFDRQKLAEILNAALNRLVKDYEAMLKARVT